MTQHEAEIILRVAQATLSFGRCSVDVEVVRCGGYRGTFLSVIECAEAVKANTNVMELMA